MNTPETDHLERNLGNAAHPVLSSFCRKLERERDELRRWTSVNSVIELQRQRDEAREQRDRMKEALERIANNDIQDSPEINYAYQFGRMEGIANIALQSLTPKP